MSRPKIPSELWSQIKPQLDIWSINRYSRTYNQKDKGKILAEIVKSHYKLSQKSKKNKRVNLQVILDDLKVTIDVVNLNGFINNEQDNFKNIWGAWKDNVIYVSKDLKTSKAKRFTIAHEIGHIFFDYEKNQDVFYKTRRIGGGNEIIIDDFAANLLIPVVDDDFEKEVKEGNLFDLSRKYDVPFDTIPILMERYLNEKGDIPY